jgi:hypothetical protein
MLTHPDTYFRDAVARHDRHLALRPATPIAAARRGARRLARVALLVLGAPHARG